MDDYSLSAALYDRCLTPLLKPLRIDIRTFIQHKACCRILDICCGTGDQLRILENGADELVGVDNSAAMLARARQNCSERVILHRGDAAQLDYPAGSFDCAILTFALHDKPQTQREQIFTSARKVLAQGGSLIVADYCKSPSGLKGFILGDIVIPVVERLAGRDRYRNYLSWQREGGIEGFLQQRSTTVDIISRRFGGTVFCCAVSIDDELRNYQKQLELLNKTFSPQVADQH